MYISQTSQNCPDFRGADGDYSVHNAGIRPEFYTRMIKNENGTEFEREFVIMRIAGHELTAPSQPVDAQIIERFRDDYEAFKSGKEAALRGTPLAEWKELTSRQVDSLQSLNIFTVEDIAQLADENIHNIFDGRILRDKAIAFLKRQAETSLKNENAELRARLDALEKGQATSPINGKPKRAPMSQAQRDKISARQKARHADAQRGLAALTEAASVTDKSENPMSGAEVLPAV